MPIFVFQRESSEKSQTTLEHERKTFDERLKRELSALKEQLQVCENRLKKNIETFTYM